MKKIILVTITTLLVSCKHGKQAESQQTMGVDTAAIELRTNRKLISIDTIMLHPEERKHLARYIKFERKSMKQSIKDMLDYEIGDGFEVLHFLSDEYDCLYDCPDIYIQLYQSEFDRLHKYLLTFPKGESKSESKIKIKGKFNQIIHRTINSLQDCFIVTTEAKSDSLSSKSSMRKIQLNYETKEMIYHRHHYHSCQTHPDDYYNIIWKNQQDRIIK